MYATDWCAVPGFDFGFLDLNVIRSDEVTSVVIANKTAEGQLPVTLHYIVAQ